MRLKGQALCLPVSLTDPTSSPKHNNLAKMK